MRYVVIGRVGHVGGGLCLRHLLFFVVLAFALPSQSSLVCTILCAVVIFAWGRGREAEVPQFRLFSRAAGGVGRAGGVCMCVPRKQQHPGATTRTSPRGRRGAGEGGSAFRDKKQSKKVLPNKREASGVWRVGAGQPPLRHKPPCSVPHCICCPLFQITPLVSKGPWPLRRHSRSTAP